MTSFFQGYIFTPFRPSRVRIHPGRFLLLTRCDSLHSAIGRGQDRRSVLSKRDGIYGRLGCCRLGRLRLWSMQGSQLFYPYSKFCFLVAKGFRGKGFIQLGLGHKSEAVFQPVWWVVLPKIVEGCPHGNSLV